MNESMNEKISQNTNVYQSCSSAGDELDQAADLLCLLHCPLSSPQWARGEIIRDRNSTYFIGCCEDSAGSDITGSADVLSYL